MPERGGLFKDSRKQPWSTRLRWHFHVPSNRLTRHTSLRRRQTDCSADRASASADHVDGGISDARVRCACLLASGATFGRTERSNPGSIASRNALCSTCTNACQVETPGLVSFPVRSTSVATCWVLEFLKR